MKSFYFFLILIIFASCESPKLDEDEYEAVKNYAIPIEQRGIRSINSSNSVLKQDLSMLGSLFTSELVLLELEDMKINTKRVLTKESGNSMNFYFHTCDSIFYFESEGNFIRKYDTAGFHIGYDFSLNQSVINLMVASPFALSKNIYFSVVSNKHDFSSADSRKIAYEDSNPIWEYNFSDSNLSYVNAFGDYPKDYLLGKDFYNHSPNVIVGLNNELILSYQSDHNLWVNKRDSEGKTIVKAKSRYIEEFNHLNDEDGSNLRLLKQYMAEEPKYENLITDVHKSYYYRIVKHRFDLDGDKKSDNGYKWSVMVLDAEFKVLKELLFSYREYTPDIFIPTSNGILVKKVPKNEAEDNGKLKLSLIDLKV